MKGADKEDCADGLAQSFYSSVTCPRDDEEEMPSLPTHKGDCAAGKQDR